MGASKFPNEQNSKLVDENGQPISPANPLDIKVTGTDNSVKIVDAGSGNPISASNPLDTQLIGTQNKVKLVDDEGNLITDSNALPVKVNGDVGFDYSKNRVKITDEVGNPYSNTNKLPVDVGTPTVNIGTMPSITVGEVEVKNDAGNPVPVTGTVNIGNSPTININSVEINNDSGNPIPVSGTVDARITDGNGTPYSPANPLEVELVNNNVTVSGSVGVTNAQNTTLSVKTSGNDTVAVTGTVNIGTMPTVNVGEVEVKNDAGNPVPVNGTVNIGTMPAVSGTVNIGTMPTVTVDDSFGINVQVINPASVSDLPAFKVADSEGFTISETNPLQIQIGDGVHSAGVSDTGNLYVSVQNNITSQLHNVDSGGIADITDGKLWVDVKNSNPIPVSGTVFVDDSVPIDVLIKNTNELAVTGTVTVANPTTSVEISNDAGNPIPISGTVNPSNNPVQPLFTAIAQSGTGATANIVNNSLQVAMTNTPTVNIGTMPQVNVGEVEVKNDTGNPVPVSGTVTVSNPVTSVEISNDAGNAIPVSGTVGVNSLPAINITNTGFNVTNEPTVKIDQATAGANHIELRDATNASHVAKVDNNGSLNTKITNDVASAVPTTFTNTSIQVSNFPTAQTVSGTVSVSNTGFDVTNSPTVKFDLTDNTVKIAANQSVNVGNFPNTQNVSFNGASQPVTVQNTSINTNATITGAGTSPTTPLYMAIVGSIDGGVV